MTVQRCTVSGCGARAWHGELCNYHALLEARARREASQPESAESRAREVRERAAELGITLDDDVVHAHAAKKARSPVS